MPRLREQVGFRVIGFRERIARSLLGLHVDPWRTRCSSGGVPHATAPILSGG